MRTEKIYTKSDKKILIEGVKKTSEILPAKTFRQCYGENLNKRQREQEENDKDKTNKQKDKKTNSQITPQQAYEMQKSTVRANNIIKTEKERVREFKQGLNSKTGYDKYEKHLEEVANMQERKYQNQQEQSDGEEHNGR